MKVVAIFGHKKAGLVEMTDPKPKNDIVLVRIHAAPMCTEYHEFIEGHVGNNFGHEAAGEIVAVDKTTHFKIGDRVVVQPQRSCGECYLCRQGDFIHCEHTRNYLEETGSETGNATMAQYMLQSESYLTKIPEGMSYDHAVMACCGLGPTFGAMQLMNVDAFDTVLISGLGPVGLGGVINARYRGARVIGIDTNPYRSELAKELGAVAVIDPRTEGALQGILDLTRGIGVDKAIETSGSPQSKQFIAEAVRRKGKIAFVGWSGEIMASTIIAKGLSVYGAWHYNINDVGRLMKVIEESSGQLDKLITHIFPMSQIQEAWETQLSGKCAKVILHPWD